MLTRRQQGPEALTAFAELSREPRLAAERDLAGSQRVIPAHRRRDRRLSGGHLDEREAARVEDQQEVGGTLLLQRQDPRQRAAHEGGPIALAGALDDGRIVREKPCLVSHAVEGQSVT